MTEKECKFCNIAKNVEDFAPSEFLKKKGRCKSCDSLYRKNRRRTNKSTCKDCGKKVDKRSERCSLCAAKVRPRRVRNPKLCEICGEKLAKKKYKLCHSCNMKSRWADSFYKERAVATMKATFDARWADPIIRKQIIKNITDHQGSSKLEKKVAHIGKLFGFESSVSIGRYLADLLNEKTKTIVEVNGDLWHCNPKFWKADDVHPNKKITAQVIWDRDAKRKEYLELLGYKVLVLWEYDINKNKDKFVKNFFETISGDDYVQF